MVLYLKGLEYGPTIQTGIEFRGHGASIQLSTSSLIFSFIFKISMLKSLYTSRTATEQYSDLCPCLVNGTHDGLLLANMTHAKMGH